MLFKGIYWSNNWDDDYLLRHTLTNLYILHYTALHYSTLL